MSAPNRARRRRLRDSPPGRTAVADRPEAFTVHRACRQLNTRAAVLPVPRPLQWIHRAPITDAGSSPHLPACDVRGTLPAVSDQASTWRTADRLSRPRGSRRGRHRSVASNFNLLRPGRVHFQTRDQDERQGCTRRRCRLRSAVLQSDEPVLVDFWAEWCGPCKMIAPALDELADTYAGRAKVVKVNVDQNRATAAQVPRALDPDAAAVQGRRRSRRTQIGAVGKAQLGQHARQGPGLTLGGSRPPARLPREACARMNDRCPAPACALPRPVLVSAHPAAFARRIFWTPFLPDPFPTFAALPGARTF